MLRQRTARSVGQANIWDASFGKQAELKAVVFALCFFHSVVLRAAASSASIGWNRAYPFNNGRPHRLHHRRVDHYLNNAAAAPATQVPWDDLRYIFGEIMYGGHITDNKDRRLCAAYLNTYLREELLDGLQFFPSFEAPPPPRAQAVPGVHRGGAREGDARRVRPPHQLGDQLHDGARRRTP